MTGCEKIEAAFDREGAPELPAVICYEGIYIRDHWRQLTRCPWWYQVVPDTARQMAWLREVSAGIGQDWFVLPGAFSSADRQSITVDARADGVWRQDARTGRRQRLEEPQVGGWSVSGQSHSYRPTRLPDTRDAVDQRVACPPPFSAADFAREGCRELPDTARDEFGGRLLPIGHVASPLWRCYSLWGFEGLMTMAADQPDLVRYAAERYLVGVRHSVQHLAAMGARAVWIEECFTDMIHPALFKTLNAPLVTEVVAEIRAQGMHSIYYYCGNPWDRLDTILAVGADALSLEEGKKGFAIDIAEVVAAVGGRCVVFGNLDAVGVLEQASEEGLRAELERQIQAGRRNGRRFVMSLGSPVTPGTPPARVRRYLELAHAIGAH